MNEGSPTRKNPVEAVVRAALDPVLGDFVARTSLRMAARRIGKTVETLELEDLPALADALRRVRRLDRALRGVRSRGGKLVWTVHNRLPHELTFRELEIRLLRVIAERRRFAGEDRRRAFPRPDDAAIAADFGVAEADLPGWRAARHGRREASRAAAARG